MKRQDSAISDAETLIGGGAVTAAAPICVRDFGITKTTPQVAVERLSLTGNNAARKPRKESVNCWRRIKGMAFGKAHGLIAGKG